MTFRFSPEDRQRLRKEANVTDESITRYEREAEMSARSRAKIEAACVRLGIELPATTWRGWERNRTSCVPPMRPTRKPAIKVEHWYPTAAELVAQRPPPPKPHPPMSELIARRPPLGRSVYP